MTHFLFNSNLCNTRGRLVQAKLLTTNAPAYKSIHIPNYANINITSYTHNPVCTVPENFFSGYFLQKSNVIWNITYTDHRNMKILLYTEHAYVTLCKHEMPTPSLAHVFKPHTYLLIFIYNCTQPYWPWETTKVIIDYSYCKHIHTCVHILCYPSPPSCSFLYLYYHTILTYYESCGVHTHI